MINNFISIISNTKFLETLVIGLSGALLIKALGITYTKISSTIFSYKNFTLTGVWVSTFNSYANNKENIEIVQIVQKEESISLYIEQYSNTLKSTKRFLGNGIFRCNILSSTYYPVNKELVQNGVFVLKHIGSVANGNSLIGIYTEYGANSNDCDSILQKGEYKLYRLSIPLHKKFLKIFKKNYFNNFIDAKKYLEENKSYP